MKYLSLPASVNGVPAYHVTAWAFYQNEHILTLTVPEGYKTIQDNACDGASGLRIVRLPSTLERLGSRTFALCANLETIDLGGLKEFVQHTFFGCVKVKTLRIPGSCKVFPTQGFCQSLADEIILEEGVTQLARSRPPRSQCRTGRRSRFDADCRHQCFRLFQFPLPRRFHPATLLQGP